MICSPSFSFSFLFIFYIFFSCLAKGFGLCCAMSTVRPDFSKELPQYFSWYARHVQFVHLCSLLFDYFGPPAAETEKKGKEKKKTHMKENGSHTMRCVHNTEYTPNVWVCLVRIYGLSSLNFWKFASLKRVWSVASTSQWMGGGT